MSPSDPLSCQELVEVVTDFLEDALPPEARVRFEAHLAICPGCRGYLAQMRHTLDLLGRLPAETITDGAWRALLEAFRDWTLARRGGASDGVSRRVEE